MQGQLGVIQSKTEWYFCSDVNIGQDSEKSLDESGVLYIIQRKNRL